VGEKPSFPLPNLFPKIPKDVKRASVAMMAEAAWQLDLAWEKVLPVIEAYLKKKETVHNKTLKTPVAPVSIKSGNGASAKGLKDGFRHWQNLFSFDIRVHDPFPKETVIFKMLNFAFLMYIRTNSSGTMSKKYWKNCDRCAVRGFQ